mmetsp:Transcript_4252/g.12987  ORF Transcript_4252/g.12987 Transcript_4252/m.12987 type:complete len:256 (+) Transcript_4252:892-1659(+)
MCDTFLDDFLLAGIDDLQLLILRRNGDQRAVRAPRHILYHVLDQALHAQQLLAVDGIPQTHCTVTTGREQKSLHGRVVLDQVHLGEMTAEIDGRFSKVRVRATLLSQALVVGDLPHLDVAVLTGGGQPVGMKRVKLQIDDVAATLKEQRVVRMTARLGKRNHGEASSRTLPRSGQVALADRDRVGLTREAIRLQVLEGFCLHVGLAVDVAIVRRANHLHLAGHVHLLLFFLLFRRHRLPATTGELLTGRRGGRSR